MKNESVAASGFANFLVAFVIVMACLAAPLTARSQASPSATAQNYPNRPVTIVVTSAAGGGVDVLVRALAVELGKKTGQSFVVDNRGGASGMIASVAVSRAAPDGYTWLACTEQHIVTNKYTQAKMAYDPQKDLTGISLLAQADQLVVASSSVPANNLGELVAYAKQQGGKLAYGSWGEGSHPHLFYSTLIRKSGIELIHVPYKGVAPVLTALNANEVQLSVMSAGTAMPLLRSGKLKVLAAASRDRSPEYPNVQTTAEAGYPELRSVIWFALMAPSGTPAAIVNKASAEVQAIVHRPDFAEKNIISKGWRLVGSDSAGLKAAIDELSPIVSEMVSRAGIKPQ
ncbi:MAG: tripartite tricarboxylate transporter substrate binding protein [Burkholderiaceae bacterium]|nr:tripartite tricarboxylate transporter substrate binding protein [Burkholderiaceae bacterium]